MNNIGFTKLLGIDNPEEHRNIMLSIADQRIAVFTGRNEQKKKEWEEYKAKTEALTSHAEWPDNCPWPQAPAYAPTDFVEEPTE